MTVDLLHNKIVKETLTEAFEKSVNDNLIPKLYSLYGVSLEGIQMYEDYIKDEFLKDGYWYYPLTVLLGEVNTTIWVKWDVSDKASFKDGNPYAYLGDGIDFSLADDVPFAFKNALEGRSTYYEGGYLKVNVTTDAPNVTFLAGKYSQTFIDEMSRQLSTAISKACGVVGIEDSSIEVDMVFAPNTYMEHTSDNVTYRRLLISAKGCAPRDFWIKWTRLNSSVAFSVNDNVNKDSILFEIGEDVSHKTREKEYRFLVYGNSDKYRVAMGRKSITEWRELIKRSVKRGELTKIVAGLDEDTRVNEVSDKLSEILEKCGVTVPALDNQVSETTNTELANEALRQAVLAEAEGDTEDILDTEPEKEDGAGDLFAEFPQAEFSFPEGLELTMNETDGSEDNFLLKNNTVSDEGEYEIEESESVFMTIEKPEPEVEEEPEQTVIDDMPDAKDASEAELGTDIDAVEEDTVSEEPELAAEEQTEEDSEESEEDVKEDTEEDAEEVEETADSVDSEERERLYAEIMSLKRALECEKLKNEKLEDEISLAQSRVERLENSLAETTGNDALLEESRAETVAARKERDELEKQLEFERIHSAELRSAMELGENTAEELAAAKLEIEKEKAAKDAIEKQLNFERLNSADLRAQIEKDNVAIEEVRRLVTEADNAKRLAEAEASRLRAENENIQRENRQLVEACRAAEEAAEKAAEELREREQELLTQIELSEKERTREKLLFAEAARQAKEENERIAEQLAEEEAARLAEEERIEKLRLEEEERIAREEELAKEKERLEREARERAEANARRRAEALVRAQETRRRMEEAARKNAEARAEADPAYASVSAVSNEPEPVIPEPEVESVPYSAPVAETETVEATVAEAPLSLYDESAYIPEAQPASEEPKAYKYVSRIARLMFRTSIDPNVNSRIHELISRAITEAGKEDVYIKVKASTPDKTTVVLNFVEIPEEEHDLLIAIINYLGNSDLGIYKVILE